MTEAHKLSRQTHSPRRLARAFALLGVYEWITNADLTAAQIELTLPGLVEEADGGRVEDADLSTEDWARCDRALLSEMLIGVTMNRTALEETFGAFVDRDLRRVSLVERAILFLGTFELMRCPQTPYRVVLNESIELAKRFGSGYRFTNAVLERVAEKVRPEEFAADQAKKA